MEFCVLLWCSVSSADRFFLIPGAIIDDVDNSGTTALMLAAEGGHNTVVKTLLARGDENKGSNLLGR